MKSPHIIVKWLSLAVALAMLLGPNLVFRSASAQGEPTPTPTEIVPEPTPSPTGESTSGREPTFQTLAVSAPTPADPDCSDGECVFWVTANADDAGTNPSCAYRTYWNEIYLGECTSGQGITSGFRFANVNLPAGAQIAEAYLEFTVDGPYTDELTVTFYGQASGNAQPSAAPAALTIVPSLRLWRNGTSPQATVGNWGKYAPALIWRLLYKRSLIGQIGLLGMHWQSS